MTIYSLSVLLFLFGNSLWFHVHVPVASWPAYRFLKKQVRWSGIPISFRIFQFIVIHTVKGFGIVSKAEIDVFLELSCFFDIPADVGNLISCSSAISKTSLNIWKFIVYILLKPGLENFEHYFTNVWDACNCEVVSHHELLIAKFRLKNVSKTTRTFRYDLNQIPYDNTVEVTNRFKGLGLIYRVPEELWTDVRDIV